MTDYEIVFDGGSKGNPGLGYGSFAIIQSTSGSIIVRKETEFGDGVTNNEAEYKTLINALEHLLEMVGDERVKTRVRVLGDSQLVINQVNGLWKIKKPELFVLRNQAVELLNQFGNTEVKWHARSNTVALLGH